MTLLTGREGYLGFKLNFGGGNHPRTDGWIPVATENVEGEPMEMGQRRGS